MDVTRTHWRTVSRGGLLFALVMLAGPLLASSVADGGSYTDMNDAQLTQALQSWGTLESSERRGLLVELKKRMERSPDGKAQAPALQTRTRGARITIYIHVRQSMRFGAGIENIEKQVGNLRSGGVVMMRDSMTGIGDARLAAREMLAHMRRLIANSEPLPGPGFGHGFERRQAYLRASFTSQGKQTLATYKLSSASTSDSEAGQKEAHLRDK